MNQLQNIVLEMVAKGDALTDTADRLCNLVERLVPGVMCSILRIDDEGKLRPLSSPSLPKTYSDAIDGLAIGPSVGSCGSAAFFAVPVIVDDIATDPRWVDFKNIALPLGLKACWSTPVFGLNGRVIATFAFYFNKARGPTSRERKIVGTCAHLCAIALDRHERVIDRERKAYVDVLTELKNRASFVKALASLSSRPPDGWALLVLDVDNLKMVNDTFGHQAGDDLLRVVASRLTKAAAPHATFRLGGDEFAILVEGGDVAIIDDIAERVRLDVANPTTCDGRCILPAVTIGAASFNEADTDADAVRRNADLALYHAKEHRRGGYVRHSSHLNSTIVNRTNAIREVALALEEGRIDAYYQPIFRLDSRKIVGVEALCRLIKADGEVLSAASFHEATADARVACAITQRMMTIAASDVRKWLEMGIPFQHVGINISSPDFHSGQIEEQLCKTFGAAGVPLKHVVLEVTESVYLHRQDQVAARVIESIRSKGVTVALDDFGTGFASLTDLLNVPIDILKIDKSFVDRLASSEASAVIVEALINVANKLGMRVIAEGVETEAQAGSLQDFGCVLAQGFLFSKAVHRDEATAFLLELAQPLSDMLRSAKKAESVSSSIVPFRVRSMS